MTDDAIDEPDDLPAEPDDNEEREQESAKVLPAKSESFPSDRMFENLKLLPSLNTDLFGAIAKMSTWTSIQSINESLSQIATRATSSLTSEFIKNLPKLAEFGGFDSIANAMGQMQARNAAVLGGFDFTKLAGISTSTLSPDRFFRNSDETNYAYSKEMKSPASYFERDEVVIESFEELNDEISKLMRLNPDLPMVWRGQQDHEWGLQSGLYRSLQAKNGVQKPSEKPIDTQPHPSETQLQYAESKLITYARENWRLDELPALELLARLQHYGAPTRLLDASRNPYIAAWFAVESSPTTDDSDSRLFALATRPVPKKGQEALVASIDTNVRLSELPHASMPFWHYWLPGKERQEADWGTGSQRRIWVPPAYDQRIISQNAAFILDGVPIVSATTAPYFKRGTTSEYWNKADLLAAASIYAKTFHPHRRPRPNGPNFSPTFTFRITQKAKLDIREVMERRFSYNYSTIYPDMSATGRYLKDHFDELTG